MPNRMIRDTILLSESIDLLSAHAERLFYRLLMICDDFGRYEAKPQVVIARAFPQKIGVITLAEIQSAMAELVESGTIAIYQHDGKSYFVFTHWAKHNRIRNQKSKFPDPPPGISDSWSEDEVERELAAIEAELHAKPPKLQTKTGKSRATSRKSGENAAYPESDTESESNTDTEAIAESESKQEEITNLVGGGPNSGGSSPAVTAEQSRPGSASVADIEAEISPGARQMLAVALGAGNGRRTGPIALGGTAPPSRPKTRAAPRRSSNAVEAVVEDSKFRDEADALSAQREGITVEEFRKRRAEKLLAGGGKP